jgi:hypothetical protein
VGSVKGTGDLSLLATFYRLVAAQRLWYLAGSHPWVESCELGDLQLVSMYGCGFVRRAGTTVDCLGFYVPFKNISLIWMSSGRKKDLCLDRVASKNGKLSLRCYAKHTVGFRAKLPREEESVADSINGTYMYMPRSRATFLVIR